MADQGNGVYIWDEDHNEWKNIGAAIGSRGEKGDPSTVPGPEGPAGVTPNISATASVDENIGTPTVNVTKTGNVENPSFAFDFKNLKGEKGDPSTVPGPEGPAGLTPNINITALVDDSTDDPHVEVIKTGDSTNPNFEFIFSGINGSDGESIQGSTGETGVTPIVTASANVNNDVGIPSVEVTKTGDAENPNFAFDFRNLKGEPGNNAKFCQYYDSNLDSNTFLDGYAYKNYILPETASTGDIIFSYKYKCYAILGESNNDNQFNVDPDTVFYLPSGPKGDPAELIAWRVRSYESGKSPGSQFPTDDCFWLTSIEGVAEDVSPASNQFFYTVNVGTTMFGTISGVGTYNGVETPYALFTDITQIQAATGKPGRSIVGTKAVFDNESTNLTFSFDTLYGSYTPTVGDIIHNAANTFMATVVNVDNDNDTYTVSNVSPASMIGPKGDRGSTGATGSPGPRGERGITPNVSAYATVDASTGTPTVNVTRMGDYQNPVFRFEFSNLKGEQGQRGERGPQGQRGETGSPGTTIKTYSVPQGTGRNEFYSWLQNHTNSWGYVYDSYTASAYITMGGVVFGVVFDKLNITILSDNVSLWGIIYYYD